MRYDLTTPCADCPFLEQFTHGFDDERLEQFASGSFPCHKTARVDEDVEGASEFVATKASQHCAGSLIYQAKRGTWHQMARIAGRLRMFDPDKLDMKALVR